MMANPNSKDYYIVRIQQIAQSYVRITERVVMEQTKWFDDLIRWSFFRSKCQGDSLSPSPKKIDNPMICVTNYREGQPRINTYLVNGKLWVPDSQERDPEKLVRSLVERAIHFLNGRKGFDAWWNRLPQVRRDEIRAAMAADLIDTLPRKPTEATVVYARGRSTK